MKKRRLLHGTYSVATITECCLVFNKLNSHCRPDDDEDNDDTLECEDQ